MQPWEVLDRARTPDGTELALARRGGEYVVRAGGHVLMSSRQHGSEEAMADVGCARLPAEGARVLVGGLGLGYTLAAVLRLAPASARVTVCELVPALVGWNRGELGALAGRPIDDPRVEVREGDVLDCLRSNGSRLDAILLDVDNGPSALTTPANGALYGAGGLAAIRRALRPGGAAVVWSAGPDPAFERRAAKAGFTVALQRVRARGGSSGVRHALFVLRPEG